MSEQTKERDFDDGRRQIAHLRERSDLTADELRHLNNALDVLDVLCKQRASSRIPL